MIEVKNLHKSYGGTEALRGIEFTINNGEIFSLLGPNGAGKTTTLKILTGQLKPDQGRATIKGFDVLKKRKQIRPIMGVVPEETNLYERLTVVQNLKFFCRLYGTDFDIIDNYLKQVGLEEKADAAVKSLSRGMKQKVLLIRALLHEPEVLFLDEPTSGLDPAASEAIHKILLDLNHQGLTLLLTSHNMEEVDKLSERVAFLDCGHIAALDTPDRLKMAYSENKIKVLLKNSDNQQKDYEEKIIPMNSEESASLMKKWMSEGRLAAVHSREPTLADIFVKLTGSDLM